LKNKKKSKKETTQRKHKKSELSNKSMRRRGRENKMKESGRWFDFMYTLNYPGMLWYLGSVQ
jgi:hypothetical protein